MPPGSSTRPRTHAASAPGDAQVPRSPTADQIYERYFEFVWRNVRRMGVPAEAVDDAVQDVFLVVHRRLGAFEGRAALETWLFGILIRVARSHRRSIKRRLAKLGAARSEPLRDDRVASEGPLDALTKQEAVRVLYRLLDELDDEKRAIFVLVELEQMAVTEAAEALKTNLNTAYARLRVARQQFEAAVARHHARERPGEP